MSITIGGKTYKTLDDNLYHNGKKIIYIGYNGEQVYPETSPVPPVLLDYPPLDEVIYLEQSKVTNYSEVKTASIAARRLRVGDYPDIVYMAYISNNSAHVLYADARSKSTFTYWHPFAFSENAIDVSICFDGETRKTQRGSEFITEQRPWIFWVTPEGDIKGRILGTLGEALLASSTGSAVSAVRATWQETGGFDFGLCVFMLLDGKLYYRQLIKGIWMDAVPVTFGPENIEWKDINAFRTWDYRIGIQGITTDGEVYEMFTQFQGLGRHGAEHLEVLSVEAGALYGGLYEIGIPHLVSAYNIPDEQSNWGKIVIFEFDRHLNPVEVADQYPSFFFTDSVGRVFVPYRAEVNSDGKSITLYFINFNAAIGKCLAQYTPGSVTTMYGDTLESMSLSWTPLNLTHSTGPVPEVSFITNVGYESAGVNRVRFYNTIGTVLLNIEYIGNGKDTVYGHDDSWTTIISSGIGMPEILYNINQPLDIYRARWTVNYCTRQGDRVVHTEYVMNGGHATWGDRDEWSLTPEGAYDPDALNNIVSNISVYSCNEDTVMILKSDMLETDYCRLSNSIRDSGTFNGRYFVRLTNDPPVIFMNLRRQITSGWASYAVISQTSEIPAHTSNSYGDLILEGTLEINNRTLYVFRMSGMWNNSPASIEYIVDGRTTTFPGNTVLLSEISSGHLQLSASDPDVLHNAEALVDRFARLVF